jgi:hypothetical protein
VPVGQRSDPFEQGEDELGITISGLPGELDEPDEPDPAGDGPRDGASPAASRWGLLTPDGGEDDGEDVDVVVFDLDDRSEMERTAVTDRLTEAGIPHGWEGTSLHVAAADEAPAANVLDIVEGESGAPLDDERDQVAYDLSDWEDDTVTRLVAELRAADIAFGWGGQELFVYEEDEETVDRLFDRVANPDQLAAEPDDGPAGAELLGDIFVAADRLQHDAEDPDGIISLLESSQVVEEAERPYGLGKPEWEHLCELVSALSELLQADEVDAPAVETSARDLRAAIRPFV